MLAAVDYFVLLFLHVALFAYWLGPDFGVYVASHYVWRSDLPTDERRRFLAAVVRMAQVSRNSLILLLLVGLSLAATLGVSKLRGWGLVAAWSVGLAWLGASVFMYRRRGTPAAAVLDRADRVFRSGLGVVLIAAAAASIVLETPFETVWLALKVGLFGVLLFNSIRQRNVAQQWLAALRLLDEGDQAAGNRVFDSTRTRARYNAFVTWGVSLTIAFLGVAKPV